MNPVSMHPKEMITAETVEKLRKNAFDIEQLGRLNETVLDFIRRQDALRIMVPKTCGGAEWSFPGIVAYLEALAWIDGNLGWLVNLGAGANMFAGYMEESVACRLFEPPGTWCAGSGATSGVAKRTSRGYILSGRWKYASGAAHATHFTANALLFDEAERPVLQKDGKQDFRSFIFPAAEVTIYNTWNTTGLKATSSQDFSVENLFVPDAHVFSLVKPSGFASGPLYHFPFDVLAVVTMACMSTGMAFHFMDLFHDLLEKKKPLYRDKKLSEDLKIQRFSEKSSHRFFLARDKMYDALQTAWNFYEKGEQADVSHLEALTAASKKAVAEARKMVYDLYPLCGMNMVFYGSELNKVWRDMAVASQHYLLSPL